MAQLRQAKADLNQVKEKAQAIMRKAEIAVQQAVGAEEKARKAERLAQKKRLEAHARTKDAMSMRKKTERWNTRATALKGAVTVIMGAHQAKHMAYEKAKLKLLGGFARRSRSRGITRSTVSTQAMKSARCDKLSHKRIMY